MNSGPTLPTRQPGPWDNGNWTHHINTKPYYCKRVGHQIAITYESFEHRPLPKGAFGTGGDLQWRHRDIFLREQYNYDFFLSQEDDIYIGTDQLDYFTTWATKFAALEYDSKNAMEMRPFYPCMYDLEIQHGVKLIDWRFKNFEVFRYVGTDVAPTGQNHALGPVLSCPSHHHDRWEQSPYILVPLVEP